MDATKPECSQVLSQIGSGVSEGPPGARAKEGNGGRTSSSPESSSQNGDGKRKRQRRRKRSTRSSTSEGQQGSGESQSPAVKGPQGPAASQTGEGKRNDEESQKKGKKQPKDGRASKGACVGEKRGEKQSFLLGLQAESVWFSRRAYEQAESAYHQHLAGSAHAPHHDDQVVALTTPDEGYLTLAPTPVTPSPINGLPRYPTELLRSVWMEKPRYDQAEAAYYQSLHAPHAPTVTAAPPPARGGPNRVATQKGRRRTENSTMENGVQCLAQEKIWFNKCQYDEAERRFYEGVNGPVHPPQEAGANTILQDIARARENIQKSLAGLKTTLHPGKETPRPPKTRKAQATAGAGAGDQSELVTRLKNLELENQTLHKVVGDLRTALSKLESRVAVLEKSPAPTAAPKPAPVQQQQPKVRAPVEEDDDDDLDLFGSDDEEEDEEAERIREQRVKEYSEKKAKKPAIIAKSSILLDVKPWDDETDMAKLEECVRSVQADGLLWGSSKLVPVGYGIKKLQIQCVVEDDKVGTDMLEEEITKFEDYVQSVDVAAFNKI